MTANENSHIEHIPYCFKVVFETCRHIVLCTYCSSVVKDSKNTNVFIIFGILALPT